MKILTRLVLLFVAPLISLEILLQIVSVIYSVSRKPISQNNVLGVSDVKANQSNEYKFMFIGDSWTVGADAPPGQGYVDGLYRLLTESMTDKHFVFNNLARSSNNSSEAISAFTRGYTAFKPHFLVVLFGINNSWNTNDIDIAQNELVTRVGHDYESNEKFVTPLSMITNMIRKLKVIRFYSLIKFNLVDSKQPLQYEVPSSDFGHLYFGYFANGEKDEALNYLVNNYQKAPSYDEFYRYVLYHFGYNSQEAIQYLSEKHIYFPEKITTQFNQKQHDAESKNVPTILEEQLVLLKELCDQNNIVLIMQTYPEVEIDTWNSKVNTMLRSIASKHSIRFVDQEQAFRLKYSEAEWEKIKTVYHVTSVGYSEMAQNLYMYLVHEHLL